MLSLRQIENRIRQWRKSFIARLFSSKRGRKLIVDAIPNDVMRVTIDAGDHRITFHPKELIGRHLFAAGKVDREDVFDVLSILDQLGLLRDKNNKLLEIGGNIGTHTIYFALTGRFSRIVTVEPDPRNLEFLRLNLDDNRLGDLVFVAECAAGPEEGTFTLYRVDNNHGYSSLVDTGVADDTVNVPVKTIQSILNEAEILDSEINLLWMDIEGYEPDLMRSLEPFLKRQVPIMMEFSPNIYGESRSSDFLEFLASYYRDCIDFGDVAKPRLNVNELSLERQRNILLVPD